MTPLPGSPATRRRVAFLFLGLGVVLALRSVERDLPREQTLTFRLPEELRRVPLRLSATVTRAGEAEARSGFTLERTGNERGEATARFRAPNGDYVLTVDYLERRPHDKPPAAEKPNRETASVHRVTLAGGDLVVRIDSGYPRD
jgi:hypothetical protein